MPIIKKINPLRQMMIFINAAPEECVAPNKNGIIISMMPTKKHTTPFLIFSLRSIVPFPQLGHFKSFEPTSYPHSLQSNAPHLGHLPMFATVEPHLLHFTSAIIQRLRIIR